MVLFDTLERSSATLKVRDINSINILVIKSINKLTNRYKKFKNNGSLLKESIDPKTWTTKANEPPKSKPCKIV